MKGNMRKKFTEGWNNLTSNQKSLLITLSAIVLSVLFINLAKIVFPGYDFSETELLIVGSINGFIASFAKNFIKVK